MDARLIVDDPAPGSWNMAVDEVLFRAAVERRSAALRLYQWSPATLSLGYFQPASQRWEHRASRHLPLVRRSSGGGAIVHDTEITYSLALPLPADRPAAAQGVLAAVHQSLVELFGGLQLAVELCRSAPAGEGGSVREPFLCFQRRAPDDLLLRGHKVGGSAQRRQKGALLQHGSLLLRRSPAAPELPGLEDLAAAREVRSELISAWPDRLGHRLGIRLHPSGLTRQEQDAAERIVREKYAADRWNAKR